MTASPVPHTGVMWTVRTRIILVIVIASALGMLSVGVVVYLVERDRILSDVDERLRASLESARVLVGTGLGGEAWPSSQAALEAVVTRTSPDDNTGALGVIDGTAALVPGVALDVDLQSAPGFVAHVGDLAQESPVLGTYAADDVSWRYLAAPIAVQGSPAPESVLFVTAYDLDAELAEIDGPARIYLIAAAIAIAVIAGSAGIVAARLLQPLRRMRETAARVSARSLAERLPVTGNDDVSQLAATMNDMLDRLDAALDAQRRLLSDVGHELKTPLTIVSGHLEVMNTDDAQDVRGTRDLVVDEIERMGRLVRDLAAEASLHGTAPLEMQDIEAAALLRQIARKAEGLDGAHVELAEVASARIVGDPARITQAMLQLVQNGVTHGGGELTLGSRLTRDDVQFWVRDRGAGVPVSERERVFERFHRGDAGRRGSEGSGLGLSIVLIIARAHGGIAWVGDAPGGGAEFVIALPRRPDGDTASAPLSPSTPSSAPTSPLE
ncbi:HAMP domain-containing histidine kinase [Agromyces atrinae]|uniref:sensor histidine kinase n=1 Tax=Agromyces atrinae TaxID=592376 RepID=UPI001F58FF40|nr:HAMP domain-containing sensor histidine kinase [Agromyces atrinae]MCI2956216.1 HAMP domain-containing histidine kinase [Agromyces atrinae]